MTKEDLNVLNYLHPLCYIVTQRSLSTGKEKKSVFLNLEKSLEKMFGKLVCQADFSASVIWL